MTSEHQEYITKGIYKEKGKILKVILFAKFPVYGIQGKVKMILKIRRGPLTFDASSYLDIWKVSQ